MPGDVVSLGDIQPHITIAVPDGMVVMPVSLLRDVSNGRQPVSVLGDDVIRAVIKDFLILDEMTK